MAGPYNILRLIGQQCWLRHGLRRRLVKRFGKVDGSFEVDYFGNTYRGDLSSYIDWHVYYFGAYARQELILLKAALGGRKDAVALDIGANNGNHTLFLATCCGHVHAFEPFPPVFKKLQARVAENRLANVTVHPVGLGRDSKDMPFYAPVHGNDGIGTFAVESRSAQGKVPVGKFHVRRGDEYLGQQKINKVDLIKIDAEGMEMDVLYGLTDTIARCRPVLFFELCEPVRSSFADLHDLMAVFPEGYRAYRCILEQPRLLLFSTTRPIIVPYDFSPGNQMVLLTPEKT